MHVILGRVLVTIVAWKINRYYIFWVCVGLSSMKSACPVVILSPVVCPAVPCFFHIGSQTTRFSDKSIVHKMYALILYTTFVWNITHSKKNQQDIMVHIVGLHVKYPLFFFSDFNETWIFWTDFREILKYDISCKSVQWGQICSMRTNRRKNRHNETSNRFSQFCVHA